MMGSIMLLREDMTRGETMWFDGPLGILKAPAIMVWIVRIISFNKEGKNR